ncbi:motility associated factor glycosyltransferase family protein [Desulfotomaculum varum]
MKFCLINTKSGVPTVKVEKKNKSFYMHSSYDPIKEAERWATRASISNNFSSVFVIVGMGAGYHIKALHRLCPNVPIAVWDFNASFASWAKNVGLLSWLNNQTHISYSFSESLQEIKNNFLPLLKQAGVTLLIHPPSLEIIPDSLCEIKQLFNQYLLYLRGLSAQEDLLRDNFLKNIALGDPGIVEWLGKYQQVPAVLISAGPSLNKQLTLLKEIAQNKCAIIASVGTALQPLLGAGISPDLVMISDAQINILEQLVGAKNTGIPLFYLSTANHQAVSYYRGPRYIVWQKGYEAAEQKAVEKREPLIKTGGSVATCLLDMLVCMGCCPIALVGQDLAYTGGLSHAIGAHAVKEVNPLFASCEIMDFYRQGTVRTSLNLLSYLHWFVRYVRDSNNPSCFWNCTEGGAFIEGWQHRTLLEFIEHISSCVGNPSNQI